jgi:RNA polymerase sigma factor (sigma-70 family)
MDEPTDGDERSIESRTLDPESTFQLIDRVRSGDQAALERLMARHLTPLRRWARGRLPRWARRLSDTDDLVQDVLLRTFRKIDDVEIRGPGALLAYLRQAVVNRVRDELRREAHQPEVTTAEPDEGPGHEMSPLEVLIGKESLERYERGLASLRPEEREVIIGRIEMGYSYAELADALGRPSADAARKAAERALVRLVEQMELSKP